MNLVPYLKICFQDMYEQRERGTAVVAYSLALTTGSTMGPIIGAAVSQSDLGWRWIEVGPRYPHVANWDMICC